MNETPDPTEVPTFDLPAWGTGGAPDLETEPEVEIVVEPARPDEVLVVTTDTLPGHRITSVTGIVAGEASAEVDGPPETAIREARDTALGVLRRQAVDAGAQAVVGVDIDVALRKGTVVVTAVGTAVELD